jgi:chemotaxis response regulator CheB
MRTLAAYTPRQSLPWRTVGVPWRMGLEGHDVVPIGGLLGRVAALARLAGGLPDDLAAPALGVVHFSEGTPSALPRILSRSGPLEAFTPRTATHYIQRAQLRRPARL